MMMLWAHGWMSSMHSTYATIGIRFLAVLFTLRLFLNVKERGRILRSLWQPTHTTHTTHTHTMNEQCLYSNRFIVYIWIVWLVRFFMETHIRRLPKHIHTSHTHIYCREQKRPFICSITSFILLRLAKSVSVGISSFVVHGDESEKGETKLRCSINNWK